MGSLQDELKKSLANETPKQHLGKAVFCPPSRIAEQQKLAGISPTPVPHPESLAGYAKAVESLSGDLVDKIHQISAQLDRYQPSVDEARLAPGRSYRDLKVAVKGLHERLVQVRRLATELSR